MRVSYFTRLEHRQTTVLIVKHLPLQIQVIREFLCVCVPNL
jgi:hypothetical protein